MIKTDSLRNVGPEDRGSHILIRGHVFTYEEKAPFAPSGMSVLGALEYDEATDRVKCHECGTWIRGLGAHIKRHGLKRREYNRKHGLRTYSALSGLGIREKQRVAAARSVEAGLCLTSPRAVLEKQTRKSRRGVRTPWAAENQNENARCRAQLIFRIQVLAALNKATPSLRNLREAGICINAIKQRFGSVVAAMREAGLQPNSMGPGRSPTPKDFPPVEEIEKRWNTRMPWPKDYFGVRPFDRREQ